MGVITARWYSLRNLAARHQKQRVSAQGTTLANICKECGGVLRGEHEAMPDRLPTPARTQQSQQSVTASRVASQGRTDKDRAPTHFDGFVVLRFDGVVFDELQVRQPDLHSTGETAA